MRVIKFRFARADQAPETASIIRAYTGAPKGTSVKLMPELMHLAA